MTLFFISKMLLRPKVDGEARMPETLTDIDGQTVDVKQLYATKTVIVLTFKVRKNSRN
jgi:hypothetical protein